MKTLYRFQKEALAAVQATGKPYEAGATSLNDVDCFDDESLCPCSGETSCYRTDSDIFAWWESSDEA